MHFKGMLEASTFFALYVIVASNCHKICCNEMVLAAFIGQLKEDWKTYKGCMAQGNFDYINSYYGDSDCKDSKEGGLGLVSHHFIDSVASYWAHICYFFFSI